MKVNTDSVYSLPFQHNLAKDLLIAFMANATHTHTQTVFT